MYSPSQQDIKRIYKPSGTFSPPPDPACIRNDGTATVTNNVISNTLYNTGHHPMQLHSQQQHGGFCAMTAGAMGISPPRPMRSSITYDSRGPGLHQQQQSWVGTSVESNTFSPNSPSLPTRDDLIISPSHSTTYTDPMYHTGEEDEAQQQRHMQEMFDKRRRRRESHNLVERRRRDNINERIQELCSLLPHHFLDTHTSPVIGVAGTQKLPTSINKGTILKLSVDHIRELQEQVMHYQQRINDLEQVLYHHHHHNNSNDNNNNNQQGHHHMQNTTLYNPVHQPLPIQSIHPLGHPADKIHGHPPPYNSSNLML